MSTSTPLLLYMDNFFTSPALALSLYDKQTYVIGTARVNRKGFPNSLRDLKTISKTFQRGDHRSVLINYGKAKCLVWMEKKPVVFINSISVNRVSHMSCRLKRMALDKCHVQKASSYTMHIWAGLICLILKRKLTPAAGNRKMVAKAFLLFTRYMCDKFLCPF